MWGVISRVATEQKLASILLVSHAMEEVEALWCVAACNGGVHGVRAKETAAVAVRAMSVHRQQHSAAQLITFM